MMNKDIKEFKGEYRWLSNFWKSPVIYEENLYPTIENAYQAAKTTKDNREPFMSYSPFEAKKMGRKVKLIKNWDEIKLKVMESLIKQKFAPSTELANKLIETYPVDIIEGNTWGDTYWGVCNGEGFNNLGMLLMKRRSELINFRKMEIK